MRWRESIGVAIGIILFLILVQTITHIHDPTFDAMHLTEPELDYHINAATEWITANLNQRATFNYYYYPLNDSYSPYNNMIRQFMASRVLAEVSQERIELQQLHKKNLDAILSLWYREKEINETHLGYIYFSQKSKLGAMAMALRTIVASPFYEEYETYAEHLYNTITYMQSEDGEFEPWFIEPSYDYDRERLLTFYSGEAILALAEYYEVSGKKEVLDKALKSQHYYIKKYVENIDTYYYPAYVPWHTISLNKLHAFTNNESYISAIIIMNDRLLRIQNTDGIPHEEYLGRFFNPKYPQYGSPHSSSDGIYTEGVAYAIQALKRANYDSSKVETYEKSLLLGLHNLFYLQYQNADFVMYPEKVEGGLRIHASDPNMRIDTTQHALDAFMISKQVLFEE
jgi:hypothetical protein